jgi:hypothetical protein
VSALWRPHGSTNERSCSDRLGALARNRTSAQLAEECFTATPPTSKRSFWSWWVRLVSLAVDPLFDGVGRGPVALRQRLEAIRRPRSHGAFAFWTFAVSRPSR